MCSAMTSQFERKERTKQERNDLSKPTKGGCKFLELVTMLAQSHRFWYSFMHLGNCHASFPFGSARKGEVPPNLLFVFCSKHTCIGATVIFFEGSSMHTEPVFLYFINSERGD